MARAKLQNPEKTRKPPLPLQFSERLARRLMRIGADSGCPQIEFRLDEEVSALAETGPLVPLSLLVEANTRRSAMEAAWRASQRLWQHCLSALNEPSACSCAARVPCPKYLLLRSDFDRALQAADDVYADEDISPC